ncbi:hypothetical protein [Mycobacteroides abscessus]|uniref:hypothetical protein n=1 Tax=Mycobacteroides abscessus TaxID=36809 RepID=UPI000E690DA1|nr:hypothetical protein [Mycobacteroides abscessus]RIR88076.1 hypothetical protein D2E66_11405 [Mycobacteroides abscessus]
MSERQLDSTILIESQHSSGQLEHLGVAVGQAVIESIKQSVDLHIFPAAKRNYLGLDRFQFPALVLRRTA